MIDLRTALDDPLVLKAAAGMAATGSAAVGWTMDNLSITHLGVPLSTVLMAFAGAAISLTWIRTHRKWWIVVIAGTMIGAVCAPLVAWGAGIETGRAVVLEKAIAFVLGLTVQIVVPSLLEWIRRKGQGEKGG